jgi:hypothetical protein
MVINYYNYLITIYPKLNYRRQPIIGYGKV